MTGIKALDQFIIILLLAMGLATVGTFVYTEILYKRPLPNELDEKAKFNKEVASLNFEDSYLVEKMIINLPSRTSRLRFLEVEMYLTTFKPGQSQSLEAQKFKISDITIDEAGKLTPDELNSISGKILFESRLKRRFNDLIPKGAKEATPRVKKILFTRFVVQ